VALDGCRSIGVGGGVAAVRPSEVGVCAILDAVTWRGSIAKFWERKQMGEFLLKYLSAPLYFK
jgi:hypothetical protein